MNKAYLRTGLGLYINYILHGMGVLIISQNRVALAEAWGTDDGGIALVISMLGIGKLLATFVSGRLSDKFGRKAFAYLGIVTYVAFFAGVFLTSNLYVACFLGIIAGLANAFLDAGTYPALMEMFPKQAGTANVLIKAFVQIGQVILPIVVSFIVANGMWYGWSFIFVIVLFALNAVFLFGAKFPAMNQPAGEDGEEVKSEAPVTVFKSQPKFHIEGVCFIIYGYIAQATFYLISQFMPQYGQEVGGLSQTSSLQLISYYGAGSLVCVGITAVLAAKIRSVYLMLVYTFMSFIMITVMWLFPTALVLTAGSFIVGFSAAGGVLQLGLTVMSEMFPMSKGTVTGIYFTCGSVASFTVPLIAAQIASNNTQGIMLFDAIVAGIGFVLALIIFIRYHQTIDTSADKKLKAKPELN